MGRAAAQHLLRAATDKPPDADNAVFPAFLVERESTAAAPK
jgi:DNA-binding LacI/PurR family transcriptional regulator